MKRVLLFIILAALSIGAVLPLLSGGLFPMHDDTQVARVITMGRALANGQFPVRWVSDLGYGYGYPIYNFYGPLPYYVGGLLYAFGVSAITATKIMFAVGILLPGITLFTVISPVIGIPAAVTAALFFLYAPYHAVQIYVRGAVGEFWAMGFWPLVVSALLGGLWTRPHALRIIIGAIGVAGTILSHTLLGYATIVFLGFGLFFYWAYLFFRKRLTWGSVRPQAAIVFGGLGLSAFFWMPALLEMGFTSVSGQVSRTANFVDHFVCPEQLWNSLWGFAGSAPGCIDGMSFMLGKVHVIGALLGFAGWMGGKRTATGLFAMALTITAVGVFFTLGVSEPVWNMLPEFPYLQYPWRFLAVAVFGLSVLTGFSVHMWKNDHMQWLVAGWLIAVLLAFNLKWFVPQYRFERHVRSYESAEDLRWRVSKISDEYLPPDLIRPERKEEVVSDTIAQAPGLSVSVVGELETEGKYVVYSESKQTVTIRRAYFPGWQYFVNTKRVVPRVRNGVPEIDIEAGQSVIEITFTDTPVRTLGNLISLFALILLTGFYYGKQRQTKR